VRQPDPKHERRAQVREAFLKFSKGFSEKPPHAEKIDRYLDALEGFPLDVLEEGFASLRAEASLPSPKKIREAIAGAGLLRQLQREAQQRAEILAALADPEKRAEMRERCAAGAVSLLGRTDLLDELVKDAKTLGLVGEDRAAKLVFLALHTRHFAFPERPVSVIVKGTSSAGKSWLVKTIVRLFAPGSVIEMTGMSAKWMVYASQQGVDFAHKMLFVHEACGVDDEVQKMLRVLLSEGRIIWRTVIEQQAHELTVEGPTGLIETTTELAVHWENETRLLSVPMDESTAQTRRVLDRLGEGAGEIALERWHALDRWVGLGPRDAVIPFQAAIGRLARPVAPRVRRDLTTLLELVRAHALLHESLREYDEAGRVIATLDDYAAVYDLTRDLFAAAVELVVNESIRDVVQAAAEIIAPKVDRDGTPPVATSAEIARQLERDRRSVNRWITAAVEAEFLEDASPRPGQGVAHRLRLGSRPLPEREASVFPTPREIKSARQASTDPCPSAQLPKSGA
jgi:hypothetical protein